MSQVPAATRTLRVLRFLASQPDPVPLAHIAERCDLPRSTAYHLLTAMAAEGFVLHLAEQSRYGLGPAAFEVGSGYARQAPLARLARRPLADLADRVGADGLGHGAHLAVLHGREVLYVIEERAPGQPPMVTEVGVRLPAQLTASGRAMLAALPDAQVRAIFAEPEAYVDRNDRGPRTLTELRRLLADTRARGFGVEDGEVTPGLATAARAVFDHNGQPVAAVAVTFLAARLLAGVPPVALTAAAAETAAMLTRRLGGADRAGAWAS
ncbi:MAG: IclR family transcriptional regulator [Nocardioides sp.]|uniref:IclR family transcriptional regulator n=1 Tax=Nocardioides sp. TaxID=35761 RepID=UPI0039E2D026